MLQEISFCNLKIDSLNTFICYQCSCIGKAGLNIVQFHVRKVFQYLLHCHTLLQESKYIFHIYAPFFRAKRKLC